MDSSLPFIIDGKIDKENLRARLQHGGDIPCPIERRDEMRAAVMECIGEIIGRDFAVIPIEFRLVFVRK